MRIKGFNPPALRYAAILKAIQENSIADDTLRNLAFIALSRLKPNEIAQRLEERTLKIIEGYAQERAAQISQAIGTLNALCQQKEQLHVTPKYQAVMEARLKLGVKYADLCDGVSLAEGKSAFLACIPSSESQKTKEKLIRVQERVHEFVTKPSGVYLAWKLARSLLNMPDAYARTEFLLPNLGLTQLMPPHLQPLMHAAIVEQMAVSPDVFNEMQARTFDSTSLKQRVDTLVVAEKEYQSDEEYQRYAAQKEVVREALTTLAKFCTVNELTAHPEITPLAKSQLEKIAQVK